MDKENLKLTENEAADLANNERQILSDEELRGVKKVLKAAALTYVASALTAIANLLRLVFIARDRRN